MTLTATDVITCLHLAVARYRGMWFRRLRSVEASHRRSTLVDVLRMANEWLEFGMLTDAERRRLWRLIHQGEALL